MKVFYQKTRKEKETKRENKVKANNKIVNLNSTIINNYIKCKWLK